MYNLLQVFVLKSSAIVMEALPFILLGSLVSSLIHVYVSEETVVKSVPKGVFRQIISGIFLALFIPSCECGIVPIVRRLNAKGVPAPMSAAYMVASPVINPVVMVATYAGFKGNAEMTLMRILISILAAFAIGFLFSRMKDPFYAVKTETHAHGCSCGCHDEKGGFGNIINHAKDDFVQTLVYLTIGAFFAGAFHVLMPESVMNSISGHGAAAIAIMMVFAVLLSVCSEADSFVASSFVHFSPASMLGFVNFGPIFDLKLVFMYRAVMSNRTMSKMVLTAAAVVYIACLLIDIAGFGV
ncbi:permease [Seleniivibrio sp.]|uniref:permease n=1 Tax=Seleniivibrio sp. TaxID=2898801 RepID=UPI0025E9EF8F|nr:permease [Seleniivibrio sp.]MCD8552492.1 permease [Seleniivibrio sp.]